MGERWLIWIQFHLHKYFTVLTDFSGRRKPFQQKLLAFEYIRIYIFWFVLIFWFLSCVKLLIIGGRCFYWCTHKACQLFLIIQINFASILNFFVHFCLTKFISQKYCVCRDILKEARCQWTMEVPQMHKRKKSIDIREEIIPLVVTESYKYQMKHSAARLWKVRDLYFDLKG